MQDFNETFTYVQCIRRTTRCYFSFHDFPFLFSWTNERLEGGSQPAEICAKVRKCNIEETMETKTRRVPKQRCEDIPYQRPVCRVETVQDPPRTVSVHEASFE